MPPLHLRPLDVTSEVPKSTQLANAIRQAIATDDLAPGEDLPTSQVIADMVGCNRMTVQRAFKELSVEGRILTESGRQARVASAPDQRRVDAARYARVLDMCEAGNRPNISVFAEDYGVDLDSVTFECQYSYELATPMDSKYLNIPVGEEILRRRSRKLIDGAPRQIQRDAIPAKLARGTVLERPELQPYPLGLVAELWDAGLIRRPMHVQEIISGDPPNDEERRLLQLRSHAAVWTPIRVIGRETGPVAVSRIVFPMPGNQMVFDFWV